MFVPNKRYFGFMTPFALGQAINSFRVEYDAELARRAYNALLPSRLSAVFAFGDLKTCQQVSALHGWPMSEVQRFELVPHDLNRVARTKMEIVSLARTVYPHGTWAPEEIQQIWQSYWMGAESIELDLHRDGEARNVGPPGCYGST